MTIYGNVKEEIPKDIPKPSGKRLIIITFLDANLLHDIVTGKSVTAVLHFINNTPTDWFLKRQATAETATHGSEFVVAKTATKQIMGLRNTLRYLGVPIMTKAYMFGEDINRRTFLLPIMALCPYCTFLGVSLQLCHAWNTHETIIRVRSN